MDRLRNAMACACLGVALATAAPAGVAQTMFKCKDGGGRVTYSNVTCEKQGLKDAGAVANRTTTLSLPPVPSAKGRERVPGAAPAPTPGSAPAPEAAPSSADAGDEIGRNKPAAQVKPVNPLIERLLK